MGSRAVFGQAILSEAETNPNIFAISGDLGDSSGLARYRTSFPERYINSGIAEQNMIGIAAGMRQVHNIPHTNEALCAQGSLTLT